MRHPRLYSIAAILVCLVSSSFAAGRARAERWKAPAGIREILMNHREAQGLGDYGKEKLKGFSAIRVTRKITRSGSASYNDACEAKEPDRIRMESGTGAVVINTASLRIETDNSGVANRRPPTPYHDSVIAMCLVPPSKSATSEKVRLVGKERVDGKMTYHLLAIDDVGQYDEWIDATNFTLAQRKQSGVILNTTEQWNDFRNVSGLMVPFDHFTRNTSTLNPWTEDEALTKFDFDPQINDADFSAEATKPTMTGSASSGGTNTNASQPAGTVISGNIGGQNMSVNVNDALATLSGRQPAAQTSTSTSSTPSTAPTAESQSTTNSNAQAAVANQVAQAAKDPNGAVTAAKAAAADKQVPAVAGANGPSVVRQIGHGQIISPACSDATNLVAIDEVSTGYKDPSADMRFTVTNLGTEELYVDRVNCKEVSRMKPRDSKRCIYASKSGWVVVVAKSKDVFNTSSGANACGEGFNALSTLQESKVGK